MGVGMAGTRIEKDSFGPIEVPAERLWGAQTERSRRFFRISAERMPLAVVYALALVKKAAARANTALGLLDARKAEAIVKQKLLGQAPHEASDEQTACRGSGLQLRHVTREIGVTLRYHAQGALPLRPDGGRR